MLITDANINEEYRRELAQMDIKVFVAEEMLKEHEAKG